MTQDLSPGVYFKEVPPKLRQIQGITTTLVAAVGVTERGPIGVATRTASWEEWTKIFGGLISYSDAPIAVYHAFLNGAREVIFVRSVHYTNLALALHNALKATGNVLNDGAGNWAAKIYGTAKAPFSLANGQTLILLRDGVAMPTLTLSATRAKNTSVNAENQDMSGGKTLDIKIDDGPTQTITFVDGDFLVPAAATAEEVAAVINAQLVGGRAFDDATFLSIESDTLGSGSKVEVTGGTAQALWAWAASASGTGNVANIAAVTISELESLIEALVPGVYVSDDGLGRLLIVRDEAGSTKTLQVDAASTLDTPLGLDNAVHVGLDQAGTQGQKTSSIAGPWLLADGDTLDIDVDGAAPVTGTFNGSKASLECANAEAYAFVGGEQLTIKINRGQTQTITFVGAITTAEQVVEQANQQVTDCRFKLSSAKTKVTIESDRGGTESFVQVTGGSANAILGFDTDLQAGSGNVEDIAAVTYEEAKLILESAVSGIRVTEDSSDYLVITRTDAGTGYKIAVSGGTARTKFGFDTAESEGETGAPATTGIVQGKTEGSYANLLYLRVLSPTSAKSGEFNLQVIKSGVVLESFANLTMGDYNGVDDPTDDRYVETIFNDEDNGSIYFEFLDQGIVGTALQRRPYFNPTTGYTDYSLSGGYDAVSVPDTIVDADILGDPAGKNGLRALDNTNDASILIVPGWASSEIHNGMLTYCEVTRAGRLFAILDPPSGYDRNDMVTYVDTTANLKNASEFAAIYWPEIKVVNPDQVVYGQAKSITIPPSGSLAGVYVRTDLREKGGVYKQPAGIERGRIFGMVGVADEDVFSETVRDLIYPYNINPIWAGPGQPWHADGSANLKRNGNFPSIAERRGVIFIEYSLRDGLAFMKHVNNTPKAREELKRNIQIFLIRQMRVGAFATEDPATAFYVDTGLGINPPSEQKARRLNARVGLATASPAEFIVLYISQDTRALEEELQSLGL